MLEYKDATIKIGEHVLATDFSFIAKDGELTCITGTEGSGKSVLLKTLMGFLPVSEGFVSVDGELLTIHSAHAFRKMMVYLRQQMHLLAHALREPEPLQSKADEYAVWNGVLPKATKEATSETLNAEDIFALAEKTLREAADKPVVIADEPTALLTPELTMCMIELLRQQAKAGKTVLIASRKPQVIDYADQVIRLEKR
jgi:ABC-type transport system involved in cytochrome bd biosynthesis fused ATPase/permease subunit